MRVFSIGSRIVTIDRPAFIVAEAGINHCGSRAKAIEMCKVAKAAGADAIKFQVFKAAEFCADKTQTITYMTQGVRVTEPMLDMFQRHELEDDDWQLIANTCRALDLTFFATPQNLPDLDLLMRIGVNVLKIGSDDFNNYPLISAYSQTGMPLILSCGMADMADVHLALQAAGWFDGRMVALLLCTSLYPTPPDEVRISRLVTLRNAFPGLVVGFSDHTQGPLASALASALGARIFEKHFTLSHDLPGPDHWFSEDPGGLKTWIQTIRMAETMSGDPQIKPAQEEMAMRALARRSVVAVANIAAGDTLGPGNIGLRRPGTGLPPSMLKELQGLRASRSIRAGSLLGYGDFE